MKLVLNTKHSIRDTQGNVTSVAWWVLRCPWHTIVSCPNQTAARGNRERNITCTTCIFTQWLHAFWKLCQFSKRITSNIQHKCKKIMSTTMFEPGTSRFSKSISATCAIDVQYKQITKKIDCVFTHNFFPILDLFPNQTSDTCKI